MRKILTRWGWGVRMLRSVSALRRAVGAAPTTVLLAALVAVAVGGIALIGHGAMEAHQAGASVSSVKTVTNTVATTTPNICGAPTTPACPPIQNWIPLSADTPGAVLTAWTQSDLYAAVQQSNKTGRGDAQYDISHPDTPVFVRELHLPGIDIIGDSYVIPLDLPDGSIWGVVITYVNDTHTAIRISTIGSIGVVLPHNTLCRTSEAQAVQAVQAQHGVSVRAGTKPYLVFFPVPNELLNSGQWKAGGSGPANPLWLIPGTDGRDHIMGNDGKVYYTSQLPYLKATQA